MPCRSPGLRHRASPSREKRAPSKCPVFHVYDPILGKLALPPLRVPIRAGGHPSCGCPGYPAHGEAPSSGCLGSVSTFSASPAITRADRASHPSVTRLRPDWKVRMGRIRPTTHRARRCRPQSGPEAVHSRRDCVEPFPGPAKGYGVNVTETCVALPGRLTATGEPLILTNGPLNGRARLTAVGMVFAPAATRVEITRSDGSRTSLHLRELNPARL